MTEPVNPPQRIYDRVYVVDREGNLVLEGRFLKSGKYDFVVLDQEGGEQLFRNYDYRFECAEAVDHEVLIQCLKHELKVLAFAVTKRQPPNMELATKLVTELTSVMADVVDLSHVRSLLRSTSGYPKGETDEERKLVVRNKLLKGLKR